MDKIICFECSQPSGQHKLSCDSRSKVEGLAFLIKEVYLVDEKTLVMIMSICGAELNKRYRSKGDK